MVLSVHNFWFARDSGAIRVATINQRHAQPIADECVRGESSIAVERHGLGVRRMLSRATGEPSTAMER